MTFQWSPLAPVCHRFLYTAVKTCLSMDEDMHFKTDFKRKKRRYILFLMSKCWEIFFVPHLCEKVVCVFGVKANASSELRNCIKNSHNPLKSIQHGTWSSDAHRKSLTVWVNADRDLCLSSWVSILLTEIHQNASIIIFSVFEEEDQSAYLIVFWVFLSLLGKECICSIML